MPALLDPAAPDLSPWLRAGDGVVAGQCCAEPTALIAALASSGVERLRVFAGMSYTDVFGEVAAAGVGVVSYGGLGRTGRVPGLQVIPCNYSALPALFAAGRLPGDVLLLQVAPPDAGGRCSLGPAAEYLVDARPHARVVIAEVNERCPRTRGASIAYDELDAVLHSDRPLATPKPAEPGPVEAAIAAHVAALVRDGDTIQLGVGTLPEAILQALSGHTDLGVHGGMITDGVLALIAAGVVTNARKPAPDRGLSVTGAALGSTAMLAALDGRTDIDFRATSRTHAPAEIAQAGRLATINGALQLDRDGNAGNESVGGRAIGAVGGQGDFLRAAAAGGGTPIVALPAARIVAALDGPVSVPRADIDWVVTEHGARSLAGLTPAARRAAMSELAGRDLEAEAAEEDPT